MVAAAAGSKPSNLPTYFQSNHESNNNNKIHYHAAAENYFQNCLVIPISTFTMLLIFWHVRLFVVLYATSATKAAAAVTPSGCRVLPPNAKLPHTSY